VVAARARRRGVAHRLLAEVINFADQHHLPLLEGYPVDSASSPRSAAAQWRGPVSLFAAAGFVEVARRQASASGRLQLIMRRMRPEHVVGPG
jgi:predicted GNAT superfamily acetyltransferase